MASLTVSVVIVTWQRSSFVRRCLESLFSGSLQPNQVIVVDASVDDETRAVVRQFPSVMYVAFPGGAGHMTTSRNVGLLHATGDVIAFLDDDTVARPSWLEALVDTYRDETVAAVAGRTLNAQPGEELEGVDRIGRLLPDGQLTGYFAADPKKQVDVDHGIGANMSFRREVLAELGGFRDDFGGVGGVREDTDMFLRVKALRYRAVFSASAAVDHLGAPHVRGHRFDFRYQFWARRNHGLLLARHAGVGSSMFRSWFREELLRAVLYSHRNPFKRLARAGLGLVGMGAALEVSLRKGRIEPSGAVRDDSVGHAIRERLSRS